MYLYHMFRVQVESYGSSAFLHVPVAVPCSNVTLQRSPSLPSYDGLLPAVFSCSWEQPDSAVQAVGLLGHSATAVGRNKLMVRW